MSGVLGVYRGGDGTVPGGPVVDSAPPTGFTGEGSDWVVFRSWVTLFDPFITFALSLSTVGLLSVWGAVCPVGPTQAVAPSVWGEEVRMESLR